MLQVAATISEARRGAGLQVVRRRLGRRAMRRFDRVFLLVFLYCRCKIGPRAQ
jgi:hypothetical protein